MCIGLIIAIIGPVRDQSCWSRALHHALLGNATDHGISGCAALAERDIANISHGAAKEVKGLLLFPIGEVERGAGALNQEGATGTPLVEGEGQIALRNRAREAARGGLGHGLHVMRGIEWLVSGCLDDLGVAQQIPFEAGDLGQNHLNLTDVVGALFSGRLAGAQHFGKLCTVTRGAQTIWHAGALGGTGESLLHVLEVVHDGHGLGRAPHADPNRGANRGNDDG